MERALAHHGRAVELEPACARAAQLVAEMEVQATLAQTRFAADQDHGGLAVVPGPSVTQPLGLGVAAHEGTERPGGREP